MNPLAAAVLISWRRNGLYGARLVSDVRPELFVAQPGAGNGEGGVMNHPAWVMSHLNLYADIAVKLARGEPFTDPAEHRYGQKSEPEATLAGYAPKERLVEAWELNHAAGATALAGAPVSLTNSPTPLERWRGLHPTVGDMLVTLMVKHESGHLGQLSEWRRGMGMGRVAV